MRGEEGIRTPGTLVGHTRFPSERLRPLGHLSKASFQKLRAQINTKNILYANLCLKYMYAFL